MQYWPVQVKKLREHSVQFNQSCNLQESLWTSTRGRGGQMIVYAVTICSVTLELRALKAFKIEAATSTLIERQHHSGKPILTMFQVGTSN